MFEKIVINCEVLLQSEFANSPIKTISLATMGKADYLQVLATARIITLQTDL